MKEIAEKWREFCNYIVESNPHYVDADFNFDNFMQWYAALPDYSDGKGTLDRRGWKL